MATFDPSWCGVHPGLTTPHGPAPTAGPLLVPLRGMPVYYTYLASPGALSAQPRAVYLTYPQRSETPAPAASFRVHHPTHIAQAAASYRHCLPQAANPGYHRVLIQGSSLNYLGQTPGQSLQYSPNQVHRAILPNLPGRIINDTIKNSAVTCPATRSVAPVTVNTQTKFAHIIAQKTNPVDFTNLDLLSTVSLRDRTKPHVDNVPKKIEQSKPKRPSKLDLSAPQTIQHRVSITETAVVECSPAHPASALGLVPVAASRKPTVWLNVTLQVDTTAEVKRGQPCAQYRSLITNILTEIYFPPCLSAPDDLLPDDMSATATYDDRGRLTVLQVEYIGPGIYRVESDGGGSPGRSCAQAVSLSRVDSLETLEPSSQYFILGDLCPVPKTFQKCHRNAQIRYKKLQEYLYSREFRKYTLPLLLQTGEDDVWTEGLKAPRTRSRAAENEDESFSRTIAKRKATATTNEEQPNVILTRSRKRARNSAQNTPLREESSSTSDVSSLSSPSEESAPSLPSLSEPTSPVTFNTESGCQLQQPTPTPPPTCPVPQAPKPSPQISISPVVNDFATPVLESPHNNPDAIASRSSTASQLVSNNALAPRSVSPTSAVLPRSAVPAEQSTMAPELPAFTARIPPYHPIHAERKAFHVGGSINSPGQPVFTARMPLHTVQKAFSHRASIVTPTIESFTFPDQPAFQSRMLAGPNGEKHKEQSCLPLARTFPTPSIRTSPSPHHNTTPRRSPYLVSPAPSASPAPSLTFPDPLDLPELSFGDELSLCLPLDLTVRPDFDTLPLDLSVSHRTR